MIYYYIDAFINASIALIILISIFSLYAIIISNKHRVMTFFLVPTIIITAVLASGTIYTLQGTPVKSIPSDRNIDVVAVDVQKPMIFMLAIDLDSGSLEPKYYTFPYTKQRARVLQDIMMRGKLGMSKKGNLEVEAPKAGGSEFADGDLYFKPLKTPPPPPKNKDTQNNTIGFPAH